MNPSLNDSSGFSSSFLHSYMDEFGLDPFPFRIFLHLSRRANSEGEAWPGIASMMKICKLSRQTVINAIRELESLNMIRVIRKHGCPSRYVSPPPSEWRKPGEPAPSTSPSAGPVYPADQSISKTPPVHVIDRHQSIPWTRRFSMESTPLKENTAAAPGVSESSPTAPAPPLIPDGRTPDGDPALFRHCHQVGTGDAVGENALPPPHVAETQTAMQRKAYAMAKRTQRLHWDNCKVRFVKETARAYAEKALRDGHDEGAIVAAYNKALRHCHGDTTDEICRGERYPHEKSSPALTVWLAREHLKGDPRTVEERWQTIIEKLTAEHRKAIEEEARILQEIAEKTPEIEAWFANKLSQDMTKPSPVSRHEIEPETVAA